MLNKSYMNTKLIHLFSHIIDGNMNELDFIKTYGSYLKSSIDSLHTYTILNDYGGYTIEFKNGKAYSVSVFNLC